MSPVDLKLVSAGQERRLIKGAKHTASTVEMANLSQRIKVEVCLPPTQLPKGHDVNKHNQNCKGKYCSIAKAISADQNQAEQAWQILSKVNHNDTKYEHMSGGKG